jgi:hypothetical protein
LTAFACEPIAVTTPAPSVAEVAVDRVDSGARDFDQCLGGLGLWNWQLGQFHHLGTACALDANGFHDFWS